MLTAAHFKAAPYTRRGLFFGVLFAEVRFIAISAAFVIAAGCTLVDEYGLDTTMPPASFMTGDAGDETGKEAEILFEDSGPIDLNKALRSYRPPAGLSQRGWGATLDRFRFLYPLPVQAQTHFSQGKVTDLDMQCNAKECKLSTLRQNIEGVGSHTMAAYYRPEYKFTVTSTNIWPGTQLTTEVKVEVHTTLWLMCAYAPFNDDLHEINKRLRFCGIRSYFNTEGRQEILRNKSPYFVSGYDQILSWLVRQYGAPDDYDQCFKVVITGADGERIDDERQKRKCALRPWKWCPPRFRDLTTPCSASITLAYDDQVRQGVIIFATKPLWRFAYAAYENGYGDPTLYELLRGLPVSRVVDGKLRRRLTTCAHTLAGCGDRPSILTQDQIDKYRIPPAVQR